MSDRPKITYPMPPEIADRSEGWGIRGRVKDHPEFKDDGQWPSVPVHSGDIDREAPETSDGDWYRNGSLI
jgi:hypothetical protein